MFKSFRTLNNGVKDLYLYPSKKYYNFSQKFFKGNIFYKIFYKYIKWNYIIFCALQARSFN